MKNNTKNITVIIFTHNEEKNIKECFETVKKLTSNVIVVDSESTDKTVEIIKKEGVEVFRFPYQSYVEPARNYGIKRSSTDWVLILDADERITKELTHEIKYLITNHQSLVTSYKIPRKNIFGKTKWLRHGGWWPDYQIRLINKKYFIQWPKKIHSTPVIKGKTGFLRNPILHYFHGDLNKMVEKTIIFEDIESDLLFKAEKKASTFIFFRKFFAELWRRIFRSLGFLDGTIGIIESIYQAFSKTITYLLLYEKNSNKK